MRTFGLPDETKDPARTLVHDFSGRRGRLEMVASAIGFGLMATAAKAASAKGIPGAEVAFFRFLVGLIVIFVQVRVRGVPLRPVRWDVLFWRGLFGGIAVLLFFLAIAALPVGTATLLNYTAPVFSTLFAFAFLGERPVLRVALAFGLAAVGVVLVVIGQSGALGGGRMWIALGLTSALMSGAAVTAIRAARRTDGSWEILTAFCLLGLVCTAPLTVIGWRTPDAAGWALLLLVGLLSVLAQLLMTHAFAVVEAAQSGVIQQLAVVTTFVAGALLYGDRLPALALAGAALTIGGVGAAAWFSARPR